MEKRNLWGPTVTQALTIFSSTQAKDDRFHKMATLHECVLEAVRHSKHQFFFSKDEEEAVAFSVASADVPLMWDIRRMSVVLGSALLHYSTVCPKHQPL